MSRAPAIGIDLGTCDYCAAVFQNGKVDIIPNNLERITPSYVSFTDKERFIGKEAKDKKNRNSKNTIVDAKRLIGCRFIDKDIQEDMKFWPFQVIQDTDSNRPKIQVTFQKKETQFYAEEILGMILNNIKKSASDFLGKEVKDAIVSVPNFFNDLQRGCIKDAATLAGINILRFITDPSAAAFTYLLKYKENINVAIIDIGGGNLSVSIMSMEDGLLEVKSVNGNNHLGGEDFTNRLVEYCINEFKTKTSINIDIRENPKAFQRIKTECEKAKIALSTASKVSIDIDCIIEDKDLTIEIERKKFEELCMDLFKKCIPPIKSAIEDAKMNKNQIEDIILIGGSTRIPKIQSMIQEYFGGKNLNLELNYKEAIATGAAIQAAVMTNVKDEDIERLILMDVISYSLGIETKGGEMTILIPRNSTLPCKKTQIFSTENDNQTSFLAKIFEGESKLTKDNYCLGSLELKGIPPMPKGKPEIEIILDIDANSNINITILEKSTRIFNKMCILNNRERLNKFYIDKKIEEIVNFDKLEIEKDKAKINFDIYCYGVKQMIINQKFRDKISENELSLITNKLEELLNWRSNYPIASPEEYEKKKNEFMNIIYPVMKKVYENEDFIL